MSLKLLKESIEKQTPISFEYNKSGKTCGKRIGNPHVVWVMKRKDGTETTKVHIVQTGGVSDSGQEFPSFRMFDIENLSEIEILTNSEMFKISEKYNPEWSEYKHVIAKI